jgi:polygalacturonase
VKISCFLNLTIQNPYDSPNTDGFDPESCRNVLLLGTKISVGDDCIAIKSGKYYMAKNHFMRTENVVIRNCDLESGHGSVTVGSEIAGGVTGVKVEQCLFDSTDRGVRIKTRRGRGTRSLLDDICFNHIRHAECPYADHGEYVLFL